MGLVNWLTVGELRKALEGVPDEYRVALPHEWDENSRTMAISVEVEIISDHQTISDDGERVLSILDW
jgi:hypothetical protein